MQLNKTCLINRETSYLQSNLNASILQSGSIISRLCWGLRLIFSWVTTRWACRRVRLKICILKIWTKVVTRAKTSIGCTEGIISKRNHRMLPIIRLQKILFIKRRGNPNSQRSMERRCLASPKWTMDALLLKENCRLWNSRKTIETVSQPSSMCRRPPNGRVWTNPL